MTSGSIADWRLLRRLALLCCVLSVVGYTTELFGQHTEAPQGTTSVETASADALGLQLGEALAGWELVHVQHHHEFRRYRFDGPAGSTVVEVTLRRSGERGDETDRYLVQPAPGEAPPRELLEAVRQRLRDVDVGEASLVSEGHRRATPSVEGFFAFGFTRDLARAIVVALLTVWLARAAAYTIQRRSRWDDQATGTDAGRGSR